jgi:MoaA/NifB/PqqE/SkfB family radical SAM enzyme
MGRKLNYDTNIQFKEQLPLPNNMLVEITNACNLSCVFCAHYKMQRKVGMMDMDLFKNIVKQAYDGGTRKIGFYLTGEPLMNNKICEYISYAKELGYTYIYMTTNGTLADISIMKNVLATGIDSIKFSINAGTAHTYEMIHGRNEFDNVVLNLINVSKYIKKENLDVGLFVSYIICKDNQNELEHFCETISEYVDDIQIVEAFNQGGHMYELNDGIMVGEKRRMADVPCKMIFSRLHITYEGYLSACCADFDEELIIADLKETSLLKAWNSDKMIKLRKMHLCNQIPTDVMCYNCINNTNYPIRPY